MANRNFIITNQHKIRYLPIRKKNDTYLKDIHVYVLRSLTVVLSKSSTEILTKIYQLFKKITPNNLPSNFMTIKKCNIGWYQIHSKDLFIPLTEPIKSHSST